MSGALRRRSPGLPVRAALCLALAALPARAAIGAANEGPSAPAAPSGFSDVVTVVHLHTTLSDELATPAVG